MVSGNFQILLWVILGGIVQCTHAVALLFCFRYRHFSWAMPVLIMSFVGRISTGLVFLANHLRMFEVSGFRPGLSAFETLILPAAQFVNGAATILLDLGLVLLLVDVSRQFQLWREAAGAADPQTDE